MAEEVIDNNLVSPIDSVITTLKILITDNITYFQVDDSELGQRLYSGLYALQDGLINMIKEYEPMRKVCANYDLSPEEPGNGFRSAVSMTHQAVMRVFDLLKQISTSRGSLLFRKRHYVKEVEAWSQAFASLATMFDFVNIVILPHCLDGELLPQVHTTPQELFTVINTVSQYAFYGRCHSFQYYESMQKVFKFLNISLCAFSEVYYSDGGMMQRTKQSLMSGSKYMLNPETRARRLVDVVQYCSVDFVKSFWALADTELMAKLSTFVGYNLLMEEAVIVPCEDLEIESVDGRLLVIKTPCSSILPNPIPCYLLSASLREGMQADNVSKNTTIIPKSSTIFFHCHGGGFVSQSTKVQAVFLREWCVKLDVPIFSVDYSLSPNAKYPRSLEEVLSAYVWMLNNFSRLGTTGERIILTGDSAGGNLLSAMTVKCIELGIRPADGMMLIYTPQTLQLNPCASRILSVLDPLLPLGFAIKCLKAYAHLPTETTNNEKHDQSKVDEKNAKSIETSFTEEEMEILSCEIQSETESFVELTKNDLISENEPDADTMTTISLASNATTKVDGTPVEPESNKEKAERSRKYVTEFLEKYVLDTRIDKEGRSIPVLRNLSDEQEDEEPNSIESFSNRIKKAKEVVWDSISAGMSSLGIKKWEKSNVTKVASPTSSGFRKIPSIGKINLGTSLLKGIDTSCLHEEFAEININSDYYINPYFAPRDVLAKFPPTYFMTAEYDFALDDCVMMAKLLRSLGVKTKLRVLDKLPHGFLNLTLVSKEAHDGNKVAIEMLKELINLNETEC